MWRDLFEIPFRIGDVPLFGAGVLLALWVVGCVGTLAVHVRRQGWDEVARGYLLPFGLVGGAIYYLPRVFETGIPIRGYGVMMLLGVVSGVGLAIWRARRVGLHPDVIISLAFWVFVAGIVGARALFVIEYWDRSFRKPTLADTIRTVLMFSEGGLVVYGALVAVLVAVVLFVRRHRLPVFALADVIAPGMPLGLAFGRVGCLLSGCCYGEICDLPWAVRFPQVSSVYDAEPMPSPVFGNHKARGLAHGLLLAGDPSQGARVVWVDAESPAGHAGLKSGDLLKAIGGQAVANSKEAQEHLAEYRADEPVHVLTAEGRPIEWTPAAALPPQSRPVHPVQVYSAITAALLCGLLLAFHPFRRRDGETFALMLSVYPAARFLEEAIRVDEPGVGPLNISLSQNISLLLLAGAAALWWRLRTRPRGTVWPVVA